MFYKYTHKTITVVGGILQCACITHCTLEYVGDLVMVKQFKYFYNEIIVYIFSFVFIV